MPSSTFRRVLSSKVWIVIPQVLLIPDLLSMRMFHELHGTKAGHHQDGHDIQGYAIPSGERIVLFANPFGDALRYLGQTFRKHILHPLQSNQVFVDDVCYQEPKVRELSPELSDFVDQVAEAFQLPKGAIADRYVASINSMAAGYRIATSGTFPFVKVVPHAGCLTVGNEDEMLFNAALRFEKEGQDTFTVQRSLLVGDIYENIKVKPVIEKIRFVLGHELSHMKNMDAFRSDVAYVATLGGAATVHLSSLKQLETALRVVTPASLLVHASLMCMSAGLITLSRLWASRRMELEADALAIATLEHSCSGAKTHFEYHDHFSQGSRIPTILSTHPSIGHRMRKVTAFEVEVDDTQPSD